MRSASFFIISLALHFSVLVLPISFHGWHHEQPIVVTIFPIGKLSSGGSGNGNRPKKITSAAPLPAPKPKPTDVVVAVAPAVRELPSVTEPVATTDQSPVQSPVALTATAARAEVQSPGGGFGGAAGDLPGGNGVTATAGGLGTGDGQGPSQGRVIITRPRYSDTPKPVYPETARREGREGLVLLRVLIDVKGNTKAVEIHRSSGSDALDQAAAEALKLWRFHPARAGDRPIEDWATVPIDFRLTDLQN